MRERAPGTHCVCMRVISERACIAMTSRTAGGHVLYVWLADQDIA